MRLAETLLQGDGRLMNSQASLKTEESLFLAPDDDLFIDILPVIRYHL